MEQFPDKAVQNADYEALKRSYALRSRTLAQAQIRIFELESALQSQESWEHERSVMFQSIMRRDVELSEVRQALQQANEKCEDLTKSVKTRHKEIAYLTGRAAKAENRLKEILESTSWKITAPARKVVTFIRRLRG